MSDADLSEAVRAIPGHGTPARRADEDGGAGLSATDGGGAPDPAGTGPPGGGPDGDTPGGAGTGGDIPEGAGTGDAGTGDAGPEGAGRRGGAGPEDDGSTDGCPGAADGGYGGDAPDTPRGTVERPGTPVPMLRTEALAKTHHGEGAPAHAVRGVDLRVERGEFVALTGPSGAGKSTLLHLLGGLQRPDSGRIWIDGHRTDGLSEARWAMLRRSTVGIVFQFFNLVSNLTVADNIELPALLAGEAPKAARAHREELLAELGLAGRERAMPGELSGGEQQRVALARALVNRPGLLLADEPTGSLDSKGTREVTRLLTRFHQRGQTTVLVTHDARMAAAVADRVITFFDGRVTDEVTLGAAPGPASGSAPPSGPAGSSRRPARPGPAPGGESGGVSSVLDLGT